MPNERECIQCGKELDADEPESEEFCSDSCADSYADEMDEMADDLETEDDNPE